MMAAAITDRLIEAIESRGFDFILVNYANADTIAHTANFKAAIDAINVLDAQIARVVKAAETADALLFITADHGNVEEMINEQTGQPESQHDISPVPLYLVARELQGRKFVNADRLALETIGSLAGRRAYDPRHDGIPETGGHDGTSVLDGLA